MKKPWNSLLFAPEGGAGGGGTGGTNAAGGDLLGTPAGGGAAGGQGTGNGSSAAAGSGNAGDAAGSAGGAATDWKSALPKELQENSQIGRYKSIEDLANGYVNLQRQFSADKLAIPGKHATDADWAQVYEKLGLPKEIKDYAVKFKDGVTVKPEFVDEFRATAHKLGILPKQAQALADWFGDKNLGAESEMKAHLEKTFNDSVTALKTEWGQAFDKNVAYANTMFSMLPEAMQTDMKDAGLARNTSVVRALSFLANKYLGEPELANVGTQTRAAMTPADAKKQVDAIMGDMKHPYFDNAHPGHAAAVKEVQQLFDYMHKTT